MSPVNLFPFKKIITAFSLLLLSCAVYAQPTYCTAGLGGAAYDAPIDSVAIVGTTLQNGTPGNPYTYSAFPITGSTTTHLQQGGTYTIVVNSNSGYFANIAMWIDFNQNGSFDVFEWFSVGTNIMGTTTATFTVPLTAHTGVTGLRVRTRDNGEGSVFAYDACTNYYSGETEDYYITIDTTLPCAGTPAVGSITGPTNICPGNPFTLSLAGYTLATGLTYQWKSSPAGAGTFTAIAGATNETYTVSSLGASTDYELVITCTASGLSSTSAIWDVVSNPPTMCYCDDSTLLGGSSYYVQLDSVAIAGTTLNNYIPSNPHIYSSFPASGSTTTHLQQGATYTIAVNSGIFEPAYVGMWIDYDHTGTFDPAEFTMVGFGTTVGTEAMTFTVPLTAHTGQTGLRVRNTDFSVSSTDACNNLPDGETEDYIVTIDTTYPCSGTPVAGAISGPDSVCAAQVFTLNVTGYTVATGLTYQWLSSPAGASSFTPIAGATDISYTVFGQAVATDYEFQVTCTSSSGTATTIKFTIGELPFSRCYCDSASLGGTPYYATIDSVGIVATTLSNNTPFNPNTYSAYPASGSTTATLQQDGYYTIAVKSSTSGDLANRSLWIDYDHSGTFDPVEWTSVGSSAMGITSAVFHVPVTAMTGLTGLRVRTVDPTDDFMGSGDACTHFFSGETEDYYITIDTAYPCSGTPVAGTISGSGDICPSYAFGLSLSGYTVATGITIQWQSSPSGAGSFTNIVGATTPLYSSAGITAATDYRAVVTCTGSGLSATTPIFTVSVNSFLSCYCSPNTGTTLVMYDGESEMTQAVIAGTTFNASGFYVPLSGYVQLAPAGSNTGTLRIGDTYTFKVVIDSFSYYPYSAGVWIDYNQNGVFDPTEFTLFTPDVYSGIFTGSVTIPSSCQTGQTGMRIISSDEYIDTTVSCSSIYYGEVADFVITIDSSTTYVPTTTTTDFSVNAFPNPATKMVTVNAHGTPGDNPAVTLTDVTGRVITKAVMTNNTTSIDMGGLAAGVYLLKYEDGKYVRVIRVTKE